MAKTYNTFTNVSTGDVYTAASHNAILQNLAGYRVPPFCRVIRNATSSIANGTDTFATFTTMVSDTGASESPTDPMWSSGSSDRITIKTAGIYVISAGIFYAANATGIRIVHIFRNPSSVSDAATVFASNWAASASGTLGTTVTATGVVACAANDAIKVGVYQTSGGPLNIGDAGFSGITHLSVAWLGQVS